MYKQIQFAIQDEAIRELLIAQLADMANGFEETEAALIMSVNEAAYDEAALQKIAALHHIVPVITEMASQNWNAVWESNFDPVIVDDFVGIRAHFHQPIPNVQYELLITPKMSFGTGHHATTHLMMQQMRHIDFTGKSVFDFGTGTGVLAILAEKLGALRLLATDNDTWCIENSEENVANNQCKHITCKLSDTADQATKFDVILANINKNVLMETIPVLLAQLPGAGVLLISGLLENDEAAIRSVIAAHTAKNIEVYPRNGWICMKIG